HLIHSPSALADLVAEKIEANKSFRKFLNAIPSPTIDKEVHKIADEVSRQIDCTQCANCCKSVEPGLHENEIEWLAAKRNMLLADFKNEFVGTEPQTGIQFLKHTPCIFLKENKCSIYADRPSACADYPHLHQPEFKFRFKSIMFNYRICPIVYNTVEQLKINSGFRS
ncbi:MAG TPA: YkgJ family cysteine cluster protein, partial [Cyclobacteriaceae bacterium]|nr:YkgJ family cysteine cluster protein [Cyclobacteriaceae bacterium]